jgi:primosomal protein N' (replication factor Y)
MMRYPPFSALANVLVRSQRQEEALRRAGEIGHLLTPPPEQVRILGPAEAPVLRLLQEYRYQLLVKAANRKVLREVLVKIRDYAVEKKWGATALVIDVDPLSLM